MLEVSELCKSFKVQSGAHSKIIKPLDGADMYVDDGEKVGIVGKSGEGKSTLANIICGLLPPSDGNVFIDEYPLFDKRGKYNFKLGKRVQLIPQQPYLSFDPMQRVGRGLEEILLVNGGASGKKEAIEKVRELFEKVLLDASLMDRLPAQLSGGQVQRVAIARVLAMHADVIICDEATAMLDMTSQAQIIDILDTLVREDGISVIFISHDTRLVESFADRIYALENGRFAQKNRKINRPWAKETGNDF